MKTKQKQKDLGVIISKPKKAYKLLAVRSDGTLRPLFIDKRTPVKLGEWLHAKSVPTKGFSVRSGWHSCVQPSASHLSEKGRQWFHVEICHYKTFEKPKSQGKTWFVSEWIKIKKPVNNKK